MKLLFFFLICFNLFMMIWSFINIYDEYSSIWIFNIIQSFLFFIFWIVIYKQNNKGR